MAMAAGKARSFGAQTALTVILTLLAATLCLAWDWPRWPTRDTLVIATADDFASLDPAQVITANSQRALACMYETLVIPADEVGQVSPWLATSWECRQDGREWIFHLRPDVVLHDGRPLTAKEVANSLTRGLLESHIWNSAYPQHQALLSEWGRSVLDKAVAVSPSELHLELRKPVLDLPEILAQPVFAISLPRLDSRPHAQPLVGTGPYCCAERRPGTRLTLKRFERYWHHRPSMRSLTFLTLGSSSARSRELMAGHVDMAWSIGYRDLDEIKEKHASSIRLQVHPGKALWTVAFNCSRHPFSDLRCRLAMQHACNRTRLVKYFLGTRGSVANCMLPSDNWAYPRDCASYTYDINKAKRLLSRSYNNDRPLELLYSRDATLYDDSYRLAEAVQRDLQMAGTQIDLVGVEKGRLLSSLATGSYDMALLISEQGKCDPDIPLSLRWAYNTGDSSLTNPTKFSSHRLSQRLYEARTTADMGKRRQLYENALQIMEDGAAELPLAWGLVVSAYDAHLSDVRINRLNIFNLSEVSCHPL